MGAIFPRRRLSFLTALLAVGFLGGLVRRRDCAGEIGKS
jgi:hypothetical protein